MNSKKAAEISAKMTELFPDLKVDTKGNDSDCSVICSAKQLSLQGNQFAQVQKAVQGHAVLFGRTGANFRMIIS